MVSYCNWRICCALLRQTMAYPSFKGGFDHHSSYLAADAFSGHGWRISRRSVGIAMPFWWIPFHVFEVMAPNNYIFIVVRDWSMKQIIILGTQVWFLNWLLTQRWNPSILLRIPWTHIHRCEVWTRHCCTARAQRRRHARCWVAYNSRLSLFEGRGQCPPIPNQQELIHGWHYWPIMLENS